MGEGRPPHANLNPLRAIFVIPSKPPPTLADPDNWSPEMLDFIRCCLHKDPAQRYDSALLSQHPFVKAEVIALRNMWGGYNTDGKGGYRLLENRTPAALPALRRFMNRMRNYLRHVLEERDIQAGLDTLNLQKNEFLDNVNKANEEDFDTFHDDSLVCKSKISKKNNDGAAAALKYFEMDDDWVDNSISQDNNSFIVDHQDLETLRCSPKKILSNTPSNHLEPSLEVDPILQKDEQFMKELDNLSQAYQNKLSRLKVAHELAQHQLLSEAKLRNAIPLSVNSLMNKAKERCQVEKEAFKILQINADNKNTSPILKQYSIDDFIFDPFSKTKQVTTGQP